MRIGLVGYGAGGRWFHAPYIDAAEGLELVGVVTRSPERTAELHAERPGVAVYASLADLLDAGVDAVTITTPVSYTHLDVYKRQVSSDSLPSVRSLVAKLPSFFW